MTESSSTTKATQQTNNDPLSFSARYERVAIMGSHFRKRWFGEHHAHQGDSILVSNHKNNNIESSSSSSTSNNVLSPPVTRLPFLQRNLSYHRVDMKQVHPPHRQNDCDTDQNSVHRAAAHHGRSTRPFSTRILMSRYHNHRRTLAKRCSVLSLLQQIAKSKKKLPASHNVKSKQFRPCIVPCQKFPPYSPVSDMVDDFLNPVFHDDRSSVAVSNTAILPDSNSTFFHDEATSSEVSTAAGAATAPNLHGSSTTTHTNHNRSSGTTSGFDALSLSLSLSSCAPKRKWNLPYRYSTAFGLFSNKVRNEYDSKHHAASNDVSHDKGLDESHNRDEKNTLRRSQILEKWNQLSDCGKYWIMEARWDQRRYKYQKSLYEIARNEVQLGCAIFSYYYHDGAGAGAGANRNVLVQLEKRLDRRCPFCFYNGKNDLGLLMHCRTVHGEDKTSVGKLTFDAGVDCERNLHVMVKGYSPSEVDIDDDDVGTGSCMKEKKEQEEEHQQQDYDADDNFIFVRGIFTSENIFRGKTTTNVPDEPLPSIPFVKLPAKSTTLLDPRTKKKKVKQLEQQMRLGDERIHPEALSQYITDDVVPIRQYFHSKTMQPMAAGDWDEDSDEESDDLWEKILAERAMEELNDVSSKEKLFMNKWNRFMESHTVVADRCVPGKCKDFLLAHCKFLFDNRLRDQYLLHLLNLWDNRLIASSKIIDLMKLYDKCVIENVCSGTVAAIPKRNRTAPGIGTRKRRRSIDGNPVCKKYTLRNRKTS